MIKDPYFFRDLIGIIIAGYLIGKFYFVPSNLKDFEKKQSEGKYLNVDKEEYKKFLIKDMSVSTCIVFAAVKINLFIGTLIMGLYTFVKKSPLGK